MKKHITILLTILCLAISGKAQNFDNRILDNQDNINFDLPRAGFEGEYTITTLQSNSNKVPFDYISYNGKHVTQVIIKGGDIMENDLRLKIHYLFSKSQNRFVFYSEVTKKGVECPLDKYTKILPTDTIRQTKLQRYSHKYEVDSSYVKTNREERILGNLCDIYEQKVNITSNKKNSSHVKIVNWICKEPEYKGWLMKSVKETKMNLNVLITKKVQNYNSSEVTDLQKRLVKDAEFDIPSGINIEKVMTRTTALLKLGKIMKEHKKIMIKQKLYPTQLPDNEIFETTEEWDD